MLPKIAKNLFREKVQQTKTSTFNFKMFLMGVLFSGTAAVASTQIPATEMNELIKEQKQISFTLQPSEEGLKTIAGHYSHSSHASHGSHRSHYSSRYSEDS